MPDLRLSKSEFEFDTLVRVAHRLGRFGSIEIQSDNDEWCLVWDTDEKEEQESVSRVRNEVYDQVIRDRLHEETKPIKDLIFAAAFSNIKLE